MKHALRPLLSDFLSTFLFVAVFCALRHLVVAARHRRRRWYRARCFSQDGRRQIEPIQWLNPALVVVLGGATILTQSPRFLMLKPTIVHFAVVTVMLQRGWMLRYLPEIVARNVSEATIVAAGYAWASPT